MNDAFAAAEGRLSQDEQVELLLHVRRDLIGLVEAAVESVEQGQPGLHPARILGVITQVSELLHASWNAEPLLAKRFAPPVFNDSCARLTRIAELSQDEEIRRAAVQEILAFAPDALAAAVFAARPAAELTAIRSWLDAGCPSGAALAEVAAALASPFEWRRSRAAARLRKLDGPDVVDPCSGVVDVSRAAGWLRERGHPISLHLVAERTSTGTPKTIR